MKKRIIFFVKQGLDKFLQNVIVGISNKYETRKIVVIDYSQIDEGMKWADICFFEWCDELIIYGSKLELAKEKKIICRLHSYEAFTDYPGEVDWSRVDKIIFVSEYIRNFTVERFKLNKGKTEVIPNGVDLTKHTFKDRKVGFNIAYVGYINYKKGPMLLLHTFKSIYDKDNRYKLYIAGSFQDYRDILYFNQMIKELSIQNNVIYEGWQNDLDKWLEDKNYILCTSILESQNISVMQAMCKGIKPVIHNFVGAKTIYIKEYVWNTIQEACDMVFESKYNSKEYRDFIEDNYSLTGEITKLTKLFNNDYDNSKIRYEIDLYTDKIKKSPNVEGELVYSHDNHKSNITVVTPFYNSDIFVKELFESIKDQSVSESIEWILVDDKSTDDGLKKCILLADKYKSYIGSIKIYSLEKNYGAVCALKFGFDKCSTKYVAWISSDDLYESKDKLEKDLEILGSGKYDVVYSNKILLGHSVKESTLFEVDKNIVDVIASNQNLLKVALFVYYNGINGSSLVFDKEKYDKCGGFDDSLISVDGDFDILIRAFLCNLRFIHDDKVVFNKIHENQTSRKKEKMLVGSSISRLRIMNILKEYNFLEELIKCMKLIGFYNEGNFKARPIFSYFVIKSYGKLCGDMESKFINYIEQNYEEDMLKEVIILSKKMLESTSFKKFKENIKIN